MLKSSLFKLKAIYKWKLYPIFAICFWNQYYNQKPWIILWKYIIDDFWEKELWFVWNEYDALENVVPFKDIDIVKDTIDFV